MHSYSDNSFIKAHRLLLLLLLYEGLINIVLETFLACFHHLFFTFKCHIGLPLYNMQEINED